MKYLEFERDRKGTVFNHLHFAPRLIR